jgi:hypothetical protein
LAVAFTVTVALVTSALTIWPANAAGLAAHNTLSVVSVSCGYAQDTNTFDPVVSVERTGYDGDPDDRVAVLLRLFEGDIQVSQLSTGVDGSGDIGTVDVAVGQVVAFSPEAGVVFGDGTDAGGGPLTADEYRLEVVLKDFSNLDGFDTESFTCEREDPCAGNTVRTSVDGFQAAVEGGDTEPRLQFSVTTSWCEDGAGGFTVLTTEAEGVLLDSPLSQAVGAAVREFLSYHDTWKKAVALPDQEQSPTQVVASGEFSTCFGIPILGKAKWLKKAPKALKVVADLIDKIDTKGLRSVTKKIAAAIKVASKALDKVIDHGGKIANKAFKIALTALTDVIGALPLAKQVDLLIAVIDAMVRWRNAPSWVQNLFKYGAGKQFERLVKGLGPDPLVSLLSDELVCLPMWTPKITQQLGQPGNAGEFEDIDGDIGAWAVERFL